MITKIFYSLVLFPEISYDLEIGEFLLHKIYEPNFWVLILEFHDSYWNITNISFQHKNIVKDKKSLSIQNWKIFWEEKMLTRVIIERLKKKDESIDFPFFEDIHYYRKIAFGVVLTITSKCNIFCYYCFNDIDYDLKYRNSRENEWFEYWKNIIDHLYENGTRVVILTGWEPMVAPFFWELLEYLKEKWIFVHINTNGTVLQDTILERLNQSFSVNIMVSLHEFNNKDYYEVNQKWLEMTFDIHKVPKKFQTLFTDKLTQLRKINECRNISLEFLTILVWKNILNLEKIYEFWKNCWVDVHSWQFFRLYGTKNNVGASKSMMELAVNKMYLLNKKHWVSYKIVDPVPFCVTKNIERSSEVIDGVLSDSHDVKTIITTQWFVQMMSAYDNNFWNISETGIDEIFKSDFVYKQLNNWFLPKECEDCKYKETCRWGSRMDANISFWSYGERDPIADFSNKVV